MTQEVIQSRWRDVLEPGTGDSAPPVSEGSAGTSARNRTANLLALRRRIGLTMKRPLALVGTLAVTAGLLAGTMVAPMFVGASSHREAPGISTDPSADNTDVYAFVSPDKPNTVTFIANYVPMQDPAGGPNFNSFSDNVLYSINVDNVGDAEDHIQYQFEFKTKLKNRNTF